MNILSRKGRIRFGAGSGREDEEPAVARPWAVLMGCGCAGEPPESVSNVHYIFGPFTTRQAAAAWVAELLKDGGHRDLWVFPLSWWGPGSGPEPGGGW